MKSNYTMKEVAKILNIEFIGRNNLYFYLKEFKVLDKNRKPQIELIKAGLFDIELSTLNWTSKRKYLKCTVTRRGLSYLQQNYRQRIVDADIEYMRSIGYKI